MSKLNKNVDFVFGINPIYELLRAKKRKISTIYTTSNPPKTWPKIKELLPKYVNVQYVDKNAITKMAGTDDHQNILAYVSPFNYRKKEFDSKKYPFILLLDGIQDPKNLGAILRSAYCTGVNGVILSTKNSSPLTATSMKSSAGLAEYLEILLAPTSKHAILELKKAGYNIFISTLEQAKSFVDVKFDLPLCLVIGSEGFGVSKDIISLGQTVKLPQVQSDISYNASVAAGIFLFNISSQNKLI